MIPLNAILVVAAVMTLTGERAQAAVQPSPQTLQAASQPRLQHAEFTGRPASIDVRRIADWIVNSNDNEGMPFVIVDKVGAAVFVFDIHGRLSADARALLGSAHGDESATGVGDKALSQIGPNERTTPAGRFVASLGQDLGKTDVLWVDYKDGIALHRVINTNPKEHRLQRLGSPSSLDKRISFGCINVPVAFYETFIKPAFTGTNGIVYILPEEKTLPNTFKGYHQDDGIEPQMGSASGFK